MDVELLTVFNALINLRDNLDARPHPRLRTRLPVLRHPDGAVLQRAAAAGPVGAV